MEEILGALELALLESGFSVGNRHIGKHLYLMVHNPDAPGKSLLVRVIDDYAHVPGDHEFSVPLAHPDSIDFLITHLTENLGLATAY